MAVNDRLQKGRRRAADKSKSIGGFVFMVAVAVCGVSWCWLLEVGLSIDVDWSLSVRQRCAQALGARRTVHRN